MTHRRTANRSGCYRGEMAVYAKPNGLLGTVDIAAAKPFRHLIVYPPLMRQIERDWQAGGSDASTPSPTTAPPNTDKETPPVGRVAA